ncbi:YbbR-like domain-containing protein [Cognatitamlana onchidii]|uniref:YbbR-like domain-containing protein n=1 Tax=Cognatitamlana onchidii TaxID=2562860 RepID=UPI0010A68F32|nr:YbbR-like domain-containing protein [Algibacter onchidii]
MKSLKSQILASFKNKRINVFLLFLLSSFVILIFTKLSKEYTNTVSFRIEKVNIPQEYVILNDSVNLKITLKTHGFKWLNYYLTKPKVVIDFTKDVYKEDSVFVYSKSLSYLKNTQFDKNVDLLSLEPERLTFRFGVNMVKKVPVVVRSNIEFSPGYDMASALWVDPDSIVVVGPDLLVSKLNTLETETISLTDVRININENVQLKLPKNSKDLKFSVDEVLVQSEVEKFTEGTLKIPVTMMNVPNGLNVKYFPKEVTVSYYVSLSNFESVTKKDFMVVCDFNKISDNQTFLKPELVRYPKTVRNTKIDYQHIEFIITK